MDTVLPGEQTPFAAQVLQGSAQILSHFVAGGQITKDTLLALLRDFPHWDPYFAEERLAWLIENLEISLEGLEEARPGFVRSQMLNTFRTGEDPQPLMTALGVNADSVLSGGTETLAFLILESHSDEPFIKERVNQRVFTKEHFLGPLRAWPEGTSQPYFNKERFLFLAQTLEITHDDLVDFPDVIRSQLYEVNALEDLQNLQAALHMEMTTVLDQEKGETLLRWLLQTLPAIFIQCVNEELVTKTHIITALELCADDDYFLFNDLKDFADICKSLDISAGDVERARPQFFQREALGSIGDARALFEAEETT